MSDTFDSGDRAAIEGIVTRLESAWNAGDGAAFGEPFASDADFVNIRAEHFRGREAIADGHSAIFRTIYAGSRNRLTVDSLRPLRSGVALVHVAATLEVPSGPLAGHHTALFSAVLTKGPSGWEIASFHNTLAPPARS